MTQGQRGKWPRLWTDLFSLFPKWGMWVRAGGLEVGRKRKDPYGLIPRTESKAAGQLFRRNGTFGDALFSGPIARRPQKETRQRRQLITYSNVKTHIDVRRIGPLMKYRHSHWAKLNHCEWKWLSSHFKIKGTICLGEELKIVSMMVALLTQRSCQNWPRASLGAYLPSPGPSAPEKKRIKPSHTRPLPRKH